MDNKLLMAGMIKGMENMGATLIKSDHSHVYFEIKIGSEIDDREKLIKSKNAFMNFFGLGIKIKKI